MGHNARNYEIHDNIAAGRTDGVGGDRNFVSQRPPRVPGWAHELKHDGYRLQIHARDGQVRLYTMNGSDWTDRCPIRSRLPVHSTCSCSMATTCGTNRLLNAKRP